MINKVYYTDTSVFSNQDVFNFYYKTISEYRKAKIDRLKLKGKDNSLAVEVLLQKALDDFGVPPTENDRKIEIGHQGKPFLINHPEIHFNLSHAGNRALCIVSDSECGCDVEEVNPNKFNIKMVKRFFSQQEIELIEAATEEKKSDLFFDFWTRKEAFGKMTGDGVNFIIGEKTDFSDLESFEKNNQCFFTLYDFKDGYKYACCSKTEKFGELIFVKID